MGKLTHQRKCITSDYARVTEAFRYIDPGEAYCVIRSKTDRSYEIRSLKSDALIIDQVHDVLVAIDAIDDIRAAVAEEPDVTVIWEVP